MLFEAGGVLFGAVAFVGVPVVVGVFLVVFLHKRVAVYFG